MSGPQLDIQLIAAVTAAACAIPGVFLVLRRMAMMSDAISHSILLGTMVFEMPFEVYCWDYSIPGHESLSGHSYSTRQKKGNPIITLI